MIIQNFSIHLWLTALMAVSFAGASFGVAGAGVSLVVALLAAFTGYFSLKMAYENRDEAHALKPFSDGAAVAGMATFLLMIFSVGLVMGLVSLLFFLHLAINFAFREHRQVYFPLLINFVALMAGAAFTFSAGYLFYLLLFCVFACFYLALTFVDKQRYQSEGDRAESIHSTHLIYQGEWRYWDKLALAGGISLLAGVIYLLTPHFAAGNLGRSPIAGFGKYENQRLSEQILPENSDLSERFQDMSDGESVATGEDSKDSKTARKERTDTSKNGSGVSDELMPDESVQQDDSIYFYVKSKRPRYLQNKTSTYFDGRSWYRLQNGWRHLPEARGSFTLYSDQPNAQVAVTVVKSSGVDIVSTDNTVGLRFPSRWVASDYYDQLKTGEVLEKDTSYELQLVDLYQNGRAVDKHQVAPEDRDLQLPKGLDPRIQALGDQIVSGLGSEVKKAQALEHHLRTQYEYTLDTLANQNNVPLSDFLFGHQRGHCEYFATSMAVLLRQQGIPARMIYGFVAQDYNPMTGFFEVKGTHAHAWVEAYVDGHWTIFEATGAYDTPEQMREEQTRNTHEVIEKYLEKQREQAERVKANMTPWQKVKYTLTEFWYAVVFGFSTLVRWVKTVLPWLMGAILGLLGGLWLSSLIRAKYGMRMQDRRDFIALKQLKKQKVPDEESMKRYLHEHLVLYQNMLARHGMIRAQGERIERFVANLNNQQLASAAQAKDLTDWVNGEFYQSHSVNTQADDVNALFVMLYQQAITSYTNKD